MQQITTKTATRAVDKLDAQKKARFIELYDQLNGHITQSCEGTGISRQTYYDWLEKDPVFAKQVMESEQHLNDEIRDVLINKAGSGDMAAVIFYLKNRHPDFKQGPHTLIQVNNGRDMGVSFIDNAESQIT